MFRKPLALSACGLAAAILIATTLWLPGLSSSQVQAALILSKLNAQMAAEPLLDITIEAVELEDAAISGYIQVSSDAVAGDIHILAGADEDLVDLDLSMAVSENGAWVLVRKLHVPDPQVRAMLAAFLTPGAETLVLLPSEVTEGGFRAELAEVIDEFRSGELVKMAKVFEQLTATRAQTGATVVEQPDGTMVLSLPLRDEQVIESVAEILRQFDHLEVGASVGQAGSTDANGTDSAASGVHLKVVKEETLEGITGGDDAGRLVGSTISVTYDPAVEQVRSVSLSGLGRTDGRVTVRLRDDTINPAWLDPARVVTPRTRTLDLQALAALFGGMTDQQDQADHE